MAKKKVLCYFHKRLENAKSVLKKRNGEKKQREMKTAFCLVNEELNLINEDSLKKSPIMCRAQCEHSMQRNPLSSNGKARPFI